MNYPDKSKKIGENAKEYVKGNLSWEKYAKDMESVFENTMASYARNP